MEVEVIGGAAPPPPDRKAIRPNPVAVGFIEEEMLAVSCRMDERRKWEQCGAGTWTLDDHGACDNNANVGMSDVARRRRCGEIAYLCPSQSESGRNLIEPSHHLL